MLIPSLTDSAFKAFLRARKEFYFEIPDEYLIVIKQQMLKKTPPDFFRAIADADPVQAKKFLKDCPELAVLARDTITTTSGYTYQNVSAMELAYLMDDDELISEVLLPAILKLPNDLITEAKTQLVYKMAEVAKQQAQFKPYDFSEMVKVITNDQMLKDTGSPSEATQKAFTKFKTNFQSDNINQGKSWIKENLQEGICIYAENRGQWIRKQSLWYLINVIGHIQTLVEKCFQQECCQGLDNIVGKKKTNARQVRLVNWINKLPLAYRCTVDLSLILGQNFFVEIVYGCGAANLEAGWRLIRGAYYIQEQLRAKETAMITIVQKLDEQLRQQPEHQLAPSRGQSCSIC